MLTSQQPHVTAAEVRSSRRSQQVAASGELDRSDSIGLGLDRLGLSSESITREPAARPLAGFVDDPTSFPPPLRGGGSGRGGKTQPPGQQDQDPLTLPPPARPASMPPAVSPLSTVTLPWTAGVNAC